MSPMRVQATSKRRSPSTMDIVMIVVWRPSVVSGGICERVVLEVSKSK